MKLENFRNVFDTVLNKSLPWIPEATENRKKTGPLVLRRQGLVSKPAPQLRFGIVICHLTGQLKCKHTTSKIATTDSLQLLRVRGDQMISEKNGHSFLEFRALRVKISY